MKRKTVSDRTLNFLHTELCERERLYQRKNLCGTDEEKETIKAILWKIDRLLWMKDDDVLAKTQVFGEWSLTRKDGIHQERDTKTL